MTKRKNSPLTQFGNKKLVRWGKWYNYTLTKNLHFSSKSVMHDVFRYGVSVQRASVQEEWNDEFSEEVDAVLNRLIHKMPRVVQILREFYTGTDSGRSQAKRIGIPHSTYHDQLKVGQHAVGYALLYGKIKQ